ncbi:MAG: hypothetical protein R3C99_03230 [Pirellulaceae bacterium]
MSDDRYANSNLRLTGPSKWLEGAVLLALILVCALAMSANRADVDFWGHVQYGMDVLADGLPRTTTYSYTAPDYPWINHENLAELLMALGVVHLGPTGLLAIKLMLGVWIVGMILRQAQRQHVSMLTLCIVALAIATIFQRDWTLRPQLLSFLYFTLMLLLLQWCFAGWEGQWRLSRVDRRADIEKPVELTYSTTRLRFLWLMPLLFVFWANSHGGFAAGLCVFIAYLGLRSLEAIVCKGQQARGLVTRFALMAAAAAFATLLNPYGPGLHLWLINSLGTPRPEIVEWHGPRLWEMHYLPIWLVLGAWIFSIFFTRRSRDFTHMTVMSLLAWQMLEHQRHAPFFAIAFGMWMPLHIESTLKQIGMARDSTAFGVGVSRPLRWVFSIVLLCLLIVLVGRLSRRLADMPVMRNEYPVSALEYMAEQDLNGKLVVTYNWAQYAIAAMGTLNNESQPGVQVQFDGRFRTCYPQDVIDMHFDLLWEIKRNWDANAAMTHRLLTMLGFLNTVRLT